MTIRVKICGITRPEDARAAAAAGADAIGLVFVGASPRALDIDRANAICAALPPFVTRVGLFMDPSAERVREVLGQVPLDWLQFHGSETGPWCRQFSRPWIKAVAMGGEGVVNFDYPGASALLLDAHAPGALGGSGETFDWHRVPKFKQPWILAGGLTPDNVAEACRRLVPDAVDVSSGVEASAGVKSDKLMKDFVQAVKHD